MTLVVESVGHGVICDECLRFHDVADATRRINGRPPEVEATQTPEAKEAECS